MSTRKIFTNHFPQTFIRDSNIFSMRMGSSRTIISATFCKSERCRYLICATERHKMTTNFFSSSSVNALADLCQTLCNQPHAQDNIPVPQSAVRDLTHSGRTSDAPSFDVNKMDSEFESLRIASFPVLEKIFSKFTLKACCFLL